MMYTRHSDFRTVTHNHHSLKNIAPHMSLAEFRIMRYMRHYEFSIVAHIHHCESFLHHSLR